MVVLAARTTGVTSKDRKPSVAVRGSERRVLRIFLKRGSEWLSGPQPSAMIDRKCEISWGEGG